MAAQVLGVARIGDTAQGRAAALRGNRDEVALRRQGVQPGEHLVELVVALLVQEEQAGHPAQRPGAGGHQPGLVRGAGVGVVEGHVQRVVRPLDVARREPVVEQVALARIVGLSDAAVLELRGVGVQLGEPQVPVQVHAVQAEAAVGELGVARDDGAVVHHVGRLRGHRVGAGDALGRAAPAQAPGGVNLGSSPCVGDIHGRHAGPAHAMGELLLLGVREGQFQAGLQAPAQGHAARVHLLPVVVLVEVLAGIGLGRPGPGARAPRRVGQAVGEALLVQAGQRGAQRQVLAQGQVHHRIGVVGQPAVLRLVERSVEARLGLAQLGLVGDEADGAAQAAGAIERALRAQQGLHPGDVLDAVTQVRQQRVVQVVGQCGADELLQVVGADRRDVQAAHRDRVGETRAVARRADGVAGGNQLLGVGDVLVAQLVLRQRADVDGHAVRGLVAPGSRHDDLLRLGRGCAACRGLSPGCRHGQDAEAGRAHRARGTRNRGMSELHGWDSF